MASSFWQRLLGTRTKRRDRHRKLGSELLESRSLMSGMHGINAPWTQFESLGTSVNRTYDAQQRLIQEVAHYDGNVQTTDWTYNDQGWLTFTRRTEDWYSDDGGDADGVVDTIQSHAYEHDAAGRVIVDTYFEDYNTHDEAFWLLQTTREFHSPQPQDLSLNWQRVSTDSDGDGVIDAVYSAYHYVYDRHNNLIAAATSEDLDLDGTMDVQRSTTSKYDQRGLLLRSQSMVRHTGIARDFYGDDSATTLERRYDTAGNLVWEEVAYDYGANGSVNFRATETHDVDGRLLSLVEQFDGNGDGVIDQEYSVYFAFNSAGQLTRVETNGFFVELPEFRTWYLNYGSLPVINGVAEYTYDARGNPTSLTIQNDLDGDGAIDQVYVSTWSEDREGNVTGTFIAVDGNDGVVDFRQEFERRILGDRRSFVDTGKITEYQGGQYSVTQGTREVTFDRQGRLLSDYEVSDDGSYVRLVVAEYDRRGNLLSVEQKVQDGNYQLLVSGQYTYDRRGRFVGAFLGEDNNGDGAFDYVLYQAVTFDHLGRLASASYAVDYGGDGVIEFSDWSRWIY